MSALLRPAPLTLALAALLGASLVWPKSAAAQRLPAWSEVTSELPRLWAERYPIAADRFEANPERLGVLATTVGGRRVYYYHFQAVVPLLERQPESAESNSDDKEESSRAVVRRGERTIELWVRYRSWESEPYDLSYLRRDHLPGTNRNWVRR